MHWISRESTHNIESYPISGMVVQRLLRVTTGSSSITVQEVVAVHPTMVATTTMVVVTVMVATWEADIPRTGGTERHLGYTRFSYSSSCHFFVL